MSELPALLPCPHCGAAAVLCHGGPGNVYVRCPNCKATSNDLCIEAEAIAAWNTRPPDAEAARLRGLLAQAEGALEPFEIPGNVNHEPLSAKVRAALAAIREKTDA